MTRKAEPRVSPRSFREKDVLALKVMLDEVFGLNGDIEQTRNSARERAFCMPRTAQWFKYQYLLSEAPKKFQEGRQFSPTQRRSAAMQTFDEAEEACAKANARIFDAFNKPIPEWINRSLAKARRRVSEVLGKFDVEVMLRHCAFSGGASTEMRRTESDPQKKWAEGAHVTVGALPYALAFARYSGLSDLRTWNFTCVDGNKVFTVPKNYKRDRTCAKEPTWNMFFQKGVGGYIRQRLQRSVGLLHPDAQNTHACLARTASSDGSLATLDLSAASDSICNALVLLLLPPDWLKVVLDLRSPVGVRPDGTRIHYEKISSMGNGYTFELETLLFYCLVEAVCGKDGRLSVYGDDIICPSNRAAVVTRLLKFCGFSLNEDKSFSEGFFRESCGGHFYRGVDVKPFYIERYPRTLAQVINLHNDIVSWHVGMRPIPRLIRIARQCRRMIPRSFWGPVGTPGTLWAEWDEARPSFSTCSRPSKPNLQCWRVRCVRQEVLVQRHEYYTGAYIAELRSLELRPTPPFWKQYLQTGCRHSYHLDLNRLRAVSQADFAYASTREVVGWVSVDVGHRWPKLPVRI